MSVMCVLLSVLKPTQSTSVFVCRGNTSPSFFVIVMRRGFVSLPKIDAANPAIQLFRELINLSVIAKVNKFFSNIID